MSRTLVVGDIHGCSYELQQLIEQAQPTNIILVGDLFTKGPDPLGVWSLIQKHKMQSVLGNHDEWLIQQIDKNPDHPIIQSLNQSPTNWLEWLKKRPLFIEEQGYIIVHAGLHPDGSTEHTTKEMALYMRHWPDESNGSKHWHEYYKGETPVIFGHDAKQGLLYKKKHNQPYIIGLDSGCTYGNQLSGFILEEQEVIQVQAQKVYCPIKSPQKK